MNSNLKSLLVDLQAKNQKLQTENEALRTEVTTLLIIVNQEGSAYVHNQPQRTLN